MEKIAVLCFVPDNYVFLTTMAHPQRKEIVFLSSKAFLCLLLQ
jgi:hypothetical protein